jgi:hypothetical protein
MTLVMREMDAQGAWPGGGDNSSMWGDERGWPTRYIPESTFVSVGGVAVQGTPEVVDSRTEVRLPDHYVG